MLRKVTGALALICLVWSGPALAGRTLVAVAANFARTTEKLAQMFHQRTGHQVRISIGSTGQLYAQIVQGAPFEVFLAADKARPRRLEARGLIVAKSRYTYAQGRLVLWSPRPGLVDARGQVLKSGAFKHLALADPTTAPYGEAAREVLVKLKLWRRLGPRLVRGHSVSQTFQFVAGGAAELGFIALSQLSGPAAKVGGSRWLPPRAWYRPLDQQAVLLKRGQNNPAAVAFWRFLRSPEARRAILSFGYRVP
jgi:molybdate transport system substrate-binding protein